jgi:hypothetical protein
MGPVRACFQPVWRPPIIQQTAKQLMGRDARRPNPGYGVVNKIARGCPDAATIRA